MVRYIVQDRWSSGLVLAFQPGGPEFRVPLEHWSYTDLTHFALLGRTVLAQKALICPINTEHGGHFAPLARSPAYSISSR